MKLGIVGLPNVGKSTLFNALTNKNVGASNYPFCTIDPNVGVVNVSDPRLDLLQKLYNSKKKVPATIEFYDIAGLVRGASKGEGLGNQFLSHIREVSAIVHMVRCFEDENITHVDGKIDPISDVETINLELALSDQEWVERQLAKRKRLIKEKNTSKEAKEAYFLLERIYKLLDEGKNLKLQKWTDEEKAILQGFDLLSIKPVLYVANVKEDDLNTKNAYVEKLEEFASKNQEEIVILSATAEEMVSSLESLEKDEFLKELGLEKSGLDELTQKSYKLLNLISFLTAGEQEVRAWTITKGTNAKDAAAKIHTDISRGFIKAEIISFDDLIKLGSIQKAKEEGVLRSEGKAYIVQDGDVILFRFNV